MRRRVRAYRKRRGWEGGIDSADKASILTGVPGNGTQHVYLCRALEVGVCEFVRHASSLKHLVHGVLRVGGTQPGQQWLVMDLAMCICIRLTFKHTASCLPAGLLWDQTNVSPTKYTIWFRHSNYKDRLIAL